MNCPNCSTWNPDDKIKCWRCNGELPRPVEKPPRRLSGNTWLWVGMVVLALFILLQQCFYLSNAPDASSVQPLIVPLV